MKGLIDKVVVVTGASSGIGRATAIEFAKHGAKVVLASRDNEALKQAELECEESGGDAMSVVCDVTQEDQVERLASRAEEAYGHIDTWINNAGVAMFAKFDESPSEDFKRVIDTNFYGYVYGAKAALKRFKAQDSGTLINIDSIEGIAPRPMGSAYAASKHAVRALSSSLRMELALDDIKNINICTVMPGVVDTPLFAHAANYTGQTVQGPERSSSPLQVAEAIVKLSLYPHREVAIGSEAKSSIVKYMLAPKAYEYLTAKKFPSLFFTEGQAIRGHGNLYDPTEPHSVHGGWKKENQKTFRTNMPWVALGLAVVGVGALASWLLWPKTSHDAD